MHYNKPFRADRFTVLALIQNWSPGSTNGGPLSGKMTNQKN